MMIHVIYVDHSHDMVDAITITSLIRDQKIRAFKRSSGWVHIGKDRIRRFDTMGLDRMGEAIHESYLPHLQESYLRN